MADRYVDQLHTRIPRLCRWSVDLFAISQHGCFAGPVRSTPVMSTCTYDWSPRNHCTVVRGLRPDGTDLPKCQDGPHPVSVGPVRKDPSGIDPERVRKGCPSTTTRSQHRLTLPRCRSSTISSNIPSTPPLFCCRNRRYFMHRPPKLLFRGKLKQPVCRLTLPTIVRFSAFL